MTSADLRVHRKAALLTQVQLTAMAGVGRYDGNGVSDYGDNLSADGCCRPSVFPVGSISSKRMAVPEMSK